MYRGIKIRMTAGAMSLKLLKRKKKTKKEKKKPTNTSTPRILYPVKISYWNKNFLLI